MMDEPPLVLYRQIGKAVAHSTERLETRMRAENDQRFAAVDERIEELAHEVSAQGRIAWLRRHKVHELVLQMEQAGADEEDGIKRQWAFDHDLTVAEVDELLRDFGR
jgi:hypothetical protein